MGSVLILVLRRFFLFLIFGKNVIMSLIFGESEGVDF